MSKSIGSSIVVSVIFALVCGRVIFEGLNAEDLETGRFLLSAAIAGTLCITLCILLEVGGCLSEIQQELKKAKKDDTDQGN